MYLYSNWLQYICSYDSIIEHSIIKLYINHLFKFNHFTFNKMNPMQYHLKHQLHLQLQKYFLMDFLWIINHSLVMASQHLSWSDITSDQGLRIILIIVFHAFLVLLCPNISTDGQWQLVYLRHYREIYAGYKEKFSQSFL